MRRLLEIHPGGEAPRECAAVAPWLADRARGRLAGAEADHVGEHLAQCADCRETLAALELVWRTESGARPDLWGRVTARLASEPRPARFQLPADEWRRAALLNSPGESKLRIEGVAVRGPCLLERRAGKSVRIRSACA